MIPYSGLQAVHTIRATEITISNTKRMIKKGNFVEKIVIDNEYMFENFKDVLLELRIVLGKQTSKHYEGEQIWVGISIWKRC